ncbi:MAG TPA: phosphoribosyltransferase [Pseudomonas xinjiangensis]|uniref:Phosphoribosyltransferase n=2 Tax=root TaxID=1 RepID=A0A7V1BMP1_9GAMM|nr:phosphoribosyltransferase [Halopseudomonas xinjiangensis]HEC49008.1 phosphoribosyltransferase [Halopseudomonas xinjiangensis]
MNNYSPSGPAFADRREAGLALVEALRSLTGDTPVILALPRGGVPVAFEIARAFKAPLDVILVRKIGAPGHEEFAIGAVVDGDKPHWVADQAMIDQFDTPPGWFEAEKQRQLEEIKRRRALYCGNRAPIAIAGREVIVVDDGVATGNTAKAALLAIADSRPSRLIFAAPVGAGDSLAALRPLVDELVCLVVPAPFRAVGLHYQHFDQTSDEQVVSLLTRAREINAGRAE